MSELVKPITLMQRADAKPADGNQPVLEVRDLSVSFKLHGSRLRVVRDLSLKLERGRCLALVGESGSGKSVTAMAILGILPDIANIDSGEILFRDDGGATTDLSRLDPRGKEIRAIRGSEISIIFQEPMTSLSPVHTIGDQIAESAVLHEGLTRRQARQRTLDLLKLIDFPDPRRAWKSYPFELSGGLRQRAMIAMAVICRPRILLADEPTTALDVTVQARVLSLIMQLQRELDMAVLMITHDLGIVANVADDVIAMHRGVALEGASVNELFAQPRHIYVRSLLKAVPRIDMAPGERLQPLSEASISAEALAAARQQRRRQQQPAAGTPLLRVDGLVRRFQPRNQGFFGLNSKEFTAVRGVSLSINRGQIMGLVGESGCGKTTLCKMIMRALTPTSGRVLHYADGANAANIYSLTEQDLMDYRRSIQFIFQDPFGSLNPHMTVLDILTEPLVIHGLGNSGWRRQWIIELMEMVGLDRRFLNRFPHSFSGGQRQRISIARALAISPEMLVCDEPVSALDVSIQAQILNLLRDLQRELKLTILFVSHNLGVIRYVADEIVVMCGGRIIEQGSNDDLFRDPRHPYTQALLAAVPQPNPRRPIDFGAVQRGAGSGPGGWPDPFRITHEDEPMELVRVHGNHKVLMQSNERLKNENRPSREGGAGSGTGEAKSDSPLIR